MLSDLTDALCHQAVPSQEVADVIIYAWDSASTGIDMPLLPPPGVYVARDSKLQLVVHERPAAVHAYDPVRRIGVVWQASAGATYTYANPLRELLVAALRPWGVIGLHAAAVGDPAGAALLVGAGGSGKSTTALACALAGMSFVAEDFCLVTLQPSPVVYSLYRSAKLSPASRAWLSPPAEADTGRCVDGKHIYLLHQTAALTLANALPVRVVFALHVGTQAHTTVRVAAPAEALVALAPTSVRLMGLPVRAAAELFHDIAALLRQTPCFHMELGYDMTGAPPLVRAALLRAAEQGQ